jgi:PAS domain S-box-containing protein
MKIKTKLTLGVGLLFLLIFLLGIVSTLYINALKRDTENILTANYNSVKYARNMLNTLENYDQNASKKFEENLKLQEQNITEIGEFEATADVRAQFDTLGNLKNQSEGIKSLRVKIYQIIDMNMEAIQRKSERAKSTASTAIFWVIVTGSLCFLIAFFLLINLPSNIADPIKKLTASISQIAAGNYSERVQFADHSEFGELAHSFNLMAQKLEEYNNSNLAMLMMEKKRIEELINNMQDPVIGLDENKKIIFINESAIEICGLAEKELIGKEIFQLAVKNDLIRMLVNELAVDETERKSLKTQPLKIYANGKESYFEKSILNISVTPTGETIPLLVGHVIMLKNITEFKELDMAKTNFIATVSHEFKTPVAAIKMSIQLLENEQVGHLNAEQKELLNGISEETERLLKITSELLDMTQVESGKIHLSFQPADPKEIISYAVQANKSQADQKHVSVKTLFSENLTPIYADQEKTAWVLTNLLSNAIRYSFENSSVEITANQVGEFVRFTVKDFGSGIPPQYQEKVFERYFKIPGSNTIGTGLGLAISKEFIEAQGGSIYLESEPGSGSSFSFLLKSA